MKILMGFTLFTSLWLGVDLLLEPKISTGLFILLFLSLSAITKFTHKDF